ncbi:MULTISPECIES: DUF4157 domain-containing protein [Undibacterium]|uniref:eCIS core domain-containing protein n=1 Tax=Undibacterium TaxID=401469 RepID=UPI001E50587C|nr:MULTISPECIES: DUF4157 domain-containing protein [Undibacterium]
MQTRTSAPIEKSPSPQVSRSTQLKDDNATQMPDTRSLQAAQRRVQGIANSSHSSAQLKMIQAKMQSKGEVAQRAEEEEPLQGKFLTVQRAEEEEPLQAKFETAQRAEEEEPLQGKFETAQRVEEEEPVQGKFATVQREEMARPNNTGLPNQLKAGIESMSGMSMDHVKVHYNSDKPAQLNAHAYAQGSDIHVAPGQERHIPHEAWHVVQQAQGRVKPTMQMKAGTPVNDDVGLETEADVMGAKALQAGDAVQLKKYNGSVKVKTKIETKDLSDWGVVRSKLEGVSKGGDAYGISGKVNDTLKKLDLATGETAMSAHMIPNRIGGLGDSSNVRPWKRSFETGTWETSVEQAFNTALPSANVGDIVSYAVETTDMSDQKADDIMALSTVNTEKTKPEHKANLLEIPLKVTATVGASSLAETDAPFAGLIDGV